MGSERERSATGHDERARRVALFATVTARTIRHHGAHLSARSETPLFLFIFDRTPGYITDITE